jgi:hypothetical protein
MKVPHILMLGPETIRLLRRVDNTDEIIGEIPTDAADITPGLKALISGAGAVPLPAHLVLPDSQILYTRVDAPGPDDPERAAQVRAALDGLTPYPTDEIAFDWSADGDTALVAAIALETLDEARNFAEAHGIAVDGYGARPPDADFPREVVFAHRGTNGGLADDAAPEPAEDPEVPAKAGPDTTEVPPDPQAPAGPEDPAPTFTTRRVTVADTSSAATPLSELAARFRPVVGPPPGPPPDPPPAAAAGVTAPGLPPSQPDETAQTAEPAAIVTTGAGFTADGVPDHGPAAASLRPRAYDDTPSTRPTGPTAPPKARPDGMAGARRKRLAVAALVAGLVVAGGWTLVATFSPPTPGESALNLPAPIEIPDTAPDPAPDGAPAAAPDTARGTELARIDPEVEARAQIDTDLSPERPAEVEALLGAGTDGWQRAPEAPEAPRAPTNAEVDIAAVDPVTASTDAFAMPAPGALDQLPEAARAPSPPAADSPEPIIVTDGAASPAPPLAPPPGGVALNLDGDSADATGLPAGAPAPTALAEALPAEVTPPERPEDLVERTERARFGGRTLDELADLRPRARPESPQSDPSIDAAPTDQAVARSPVPPGRPEDMQEVVALAQAALSPAQPAAAAAASTAGLSDAGQSPAAATTDDEPEPEITTASAPPSLPTRAEVAREATIENAIRLGQVNLIGVYGSSSDRRALIRLPSGRFVKVKVGDRIDGGQIAAIGDDSLSYVKGGRNVTLTVPSG